VDIAVGVGRPIVQDEGLTRGVLLEGGVVNVGLLQRFQAFRLPLRKAGLHREARTREVEGVFQAH
jgi:hypothetical protein